MTPKQKEQKKRQRLREQQRKERQRVKRQERALPKAALRVWSQRVAERDGCVCAVCGCKAEQRKDKSGQLRVNKQGRPIIAHLHAHHLLPKERYREYRFNPINGILLCPSHHKYGKFSAHRNPIWFTLWLRANRPQQYRWCKEHLER